MKKLILAFIIFSCSEQEIEQEKGCHMGRLKGEKEYVFIRCSTTEQYLAGNNENMGGLDKLTYSLYDIHKFEKYCDRCK